jgi:NUMOD1 domain
MFGKPRPEGAGKPCQKIEVFDKDNNETTTYDSISAAAIALNIRQTSISEYLRNNRTNLFKNRYVFKKVVS